MKYPEVLNHPINNDIQEIYKNNENDENKSSKLDDDDVRAEKRKFEKFNYDIDDNDIDDKNFYNNDINVCDNDNDGDTNYDNNENIDSKRVLNINKKPRIASIENDYSGFNNNNYDNYDYINDIDRKNDQNMNNIDSRAEANNFCIDDEIEGLNLIISSVNSINWIDTMIYDTRKDQLHDEHTENVVNSVNEDELKVDEINDTIDKGSTKINENNRKKLDNITPLPSIQKHTESEEKEVVTLVGADIRISVNPDNQVSVNPDIRSSVNPDIHLSVNTVLSSPSSSKIVECRENKLHLDLLSSCRMHRNGVLRASTASAGIIYSHEYMYIYINIFLLI
jgi:hypothetical protein